MNNNYTFLATIFSLCVLLPLSGCGGGVKAGGSVSFADGTAVTGGTVVFSDAQHQYTGAIQPDGTFQLGGLKPGDGLPPGRYRVAVIEVYEGGAPILDEKYESPDRSEISFEVTGGRNEPFSITVERSRTPRAALE